MFKAKNRKNIFASKRYKIERSSVRYRNPFHIKKGLFNFKVFKVINIILIIGILACLYFFIFSNFYNITNIEVFGNQIISADDILDITNNYLATNKLFIFKNRNIFIFNKNEFKKKINQAILLDDIKIEKILPNTIRLTLKEKNVALKWISNDQEYLIDRQGIIIKRIYKLTTPEIFQINKPAQSTNSALTADNYLIVKNSANNDANLGDKVLNPENIDFIFKLKEQTDKLGYFQIKDVLVPNNLPQFIIIETNSGWQVFFNLADNLDDQINRLNVLIRDKIKKENLNRLEYIDLRLGESVYYKFKEQQKQQS